MAIYFGTVACFKYTFCTLFSIASCRLVRCDITIKYHFMPDKVDLSINSDYYSAYCNIGLHE